MNRFSRAVIEKRVELMEKKGDIFFRKPRGEREREKKRGKGEKRGYNLHRVTWATGRD